MDIIPFLQWTSYVVVSLCLIALGFLTIMLTCLFILICLTIIAEKIIKHYNQLKEAFDQEDEELALAPRCALLSGALCQGPSCPYYTEDCPELINTVDVREDDIRDRHS